MIGAWSFTKIRFLLIRVLINEERAFEIAFTVPRLQMMRLACIQFLLTCKNSLKCDLITSGLFEFVFKSGYPKMQFTFFFAIT